MLGPVRPTAGSQTGNRGGRFRGDGVLSAPLPLRPVNRAQAIRRGAARRSGGGSANSCSLTVRFPPLNRLGNRMRKPRRDRPIRGIGARLQGENGAGNRRAGRDLNETALPPVGERRRRPPMASVRRTVALPLAFVVCVLAVAGVAATPAIAAGKSLATAAPQDASAVEASLALDRATRRLIQQRLRNEGFDPGTPDGLFGPRTRAAIREWQQSRGASPTGYLNSADVELLRAAAAPPPAVPQGWVVSANRRPAPTPTETDSNPAQTTVATQEVNAQSAAETNTQQRTRAVPGTGTVQLPPEIQADRHLLRAERLLADGNPADALEEMNEILALQQEHDLVLHDGFAFEHARVAYAAGHTQTAIASANQYLAAAGRDGQFYREALELLDSAEVRLEREAADRRRAEAERRSAEAERRAAARWPPGHVFRGLRNVPRDGGPAGERCGARPLRGDGCGVPRVRVDDRRRPSQPLPEHLRRTRQRPRRLLGPLLARPRLSADGSPSRDLHELGRRSVVRGLAQPNHGRAVPSANSGRVDRGRGRFAAWLHPVAYRPSPPRHVSRRHPRPQWSRFIGPARERVRVDVPLRRWGLLASRR